MGNSKETSRNKQCIACSNDSEKFSGYCTKCKTTTSQGFKKQFSSFPIYAWGLFSVVFLFYCYALDEGSNRNYQDALDWCKKNNITLATNRKERTHFCENEDGKLFIAKTRYSK